MTEQKENQANIFHARFGRWDNEKSLVFDEPIDILYATDQFSILDMDDDSIVSMHQQLADGIYSLAIAGMDGDSIQIFQDGGHKGARFEIANFSWSETPVYLYLRDRKQVLEITHDNRISVDRANEDYRKLHSDPGAGQKPEKILIIPLDKSIQFKILG